MEKITFTTSEISETIEEVLNNDGVIALGVTGGSMTPYLKHNRDIVFIRRPDMNKLKKGQILLFKRSDGRLILHRVRKILSDNRLLMNGDSQDWCEEIKHDQIIGEAFKIQRKSKELSADSFEFRLWNVLWCPTRAVRPVIFKIIEKIKKRKSRLKNRLF